MAKSMYDIIKKQNGETFAKAIRNYDNGIFDVPNIDKIVKYAGRDAEPIMAYLLSLKKIEIQEHSVHMNPLKLLDMAGYDAYVADTLKKQNAIKKYYKYDEELCTFRDPHRFEKYFIINAVRKDVDKIKRSKLKNPERDDEYGTSVMSIQILKTGGFISIKNRYNHTVDNPDNTLNSNPDNIIPGLSDAIKHYFNVDFSSQKVTVPNGYTIINDQIIRYNGERNNVYFSENFFARDGEIIPINTNSEIMLGNGLLLNLQKKQIDDITITNYSAFTLAPGMREKFVQSLNECIANKKLSVKKNNQGHHEIFADNIHVFTVCSGELINLNVPNAKSVPLSGYKKLSGTLDFSGVEELDFLTADISQVKDIKFNKNAKTIRLCNAIGAELRGTLDFSGVQDLRLGDVKCNNVQNIKLNPNAKYIDLNGAWGLKLYGDLDFSNVEYLNLSRVDMSGVRSIKLNPNAKLIYLQHTKLNGVLDFSNVQKLILSQIDMTNVTEIKMPKKAERVTMNTVKGLKLNNTLDFSGVNELFLNDTNLSNVRNLIFNPSAKEVSLKAAGRLHGKLDFSKAEAIDLSYTDVSDAEIIFNKSADRISITNTKGLRGNLDFSKVRITHASLTNFSNTDSVLFNPNALYISLNYTKGLKGFLDFHNIRSLRISGADLTNVTGLKINPDCDLDGDLKTILLRVGKSITESKIAMLRKKIKKMFNPQEKNNDK